MGRIFFRQPAEYIPRVSFSMSEGLKLGGKMKTFAYVALAAALCGALACKKQTTVQTDQGSVTVKQQGKETTATFKDESGKEISVSTAEGKLPDNFPKDMPLPEGVKVISHLSMEEGMSVQLEAKQSPSEVADFYKKAFREKGWKISADASFGDNATISAEKDEESANIVVTKGGAGSNIVLSYSRKQS